MIADIDKDGRCGARPACVRVVNSCSPLPAQRQSAPTTLTRRPRSPPRSGTIDFEEFLQMMTAKMSERDSREEILKAFKLFDDDSTGACAPAWRALECAAVAPPCAACWLPQPPLANAAHPPTPLFAPPSPPGRITFKNLKRVAKELGENLTDEEIQEMIDEADRNGDGEVCRRDGVRGAAQPAACHAACWRRKHKRNTALTPAPHPVPPAPPG